MTTIWDRIADTLPELQRQAEGGMIETCRIDRVVGVTTDDEGRPTAQLQDPPVYVGPVKIRSYRPYEQEREVAGSTDAYQRYDLHIPAVTRMAELKAAGVVTEWNGPVRNGDFMTRTTPGRPSEVYRIATEHDITWQTAQRLVGDLSTAGITTTTG